MKRPLPLADHVTRRTALTGAATLTVGVPLLAACGADEQTAADTASPSPSPSSSAPSSAAAPSDAASEPVASGGATGIASTSDIEVGGGAIFADEEVVVVQPTEGDFKAFSSICTHQGCPVQSVTSEGIVCPCHNSVFSLEDGSPTSGPADEPLSSVDITVEGDQIILA